MSDTFTELKNNVMVLDDLIHGNSARIPGDVADKMKKHVRSALAIIVAAEATRYSGLDRRSLLPTSDDVAPEDNPSSDDTSAKEFKPDAPAPAAEVKWKPGVLDHIWENTETGMFHFSDEAEQIGNTGYPTEVEANAALQDYVKKYLNADNQQTGDKTASGDDKVEQQSIGASDVGDLRAVLGDGAGADQKPATAPETPPVDPTKPKKAK